MTLVRPRALVAAMDGTRADLVVFFASIWWDRPGTDRYLAEALSRHCPVLFVDPPASPLTRLWHPELAASLAAKPTLQVLNPRLATVAPRVLPGMTRPMLHHLVAPMLRRVTRAAIRRLYGTQSGPVAAMVSTRLDDLWSTVPARRRTYCGTDDLVAGADLFGVPRRRLIRAESRTLRGADSVVAVSQVLVDRYTRAGHAATLLPNGCRDAAFSNVDSVPVPADVNLPAPVAGFAGQINDRIDLTLLEAVADTGCSLLLVGKRAAGYQPDRFAALTARPNVWWVGPKPLTDMPAYLRVIDVGLTPYRDNDFNRASFPLKTLEYLAAGRAAVSTPLPATEWLGTDLIDVAAGPAGFAAAVTAALARPRTPALVRRRQAFAREHSWDQRATILAGLLGVSVGEATRTDQTVPADGGPR
jgi:teichuronic acid biosynthesis glycosyltransferase TuaH